MEFTQLIAQRYSCKNFGAGKVDAAALHTILEAGRLAPTAKNTQEHGLCRYCSRRNIGAVYG